MKMENKAIPQKLADYFSTVPMAAIAFSGGVDSGYLLYAAKTGSTDVYAYYVKSQFQPEFELEDARRLAAELDVRMTVIPLDVLAYHTIAANPADRCYHCKRVIFEQIIKIAAADGYTVLMDGSNASDDAGDRPGMRALAELQVISPLRDMGLTKAQVREYSQEAGLFIWNKPAYACLATRVPTGVKLTSQMLERIEKCEDALAKMGFSDFRARVLNNAVKLQFPAEQIPIAAQRHSELAEQLSIWFDDILLDLKPR